MFTFAKKAIKWYCNATAEAYNTDVEKEEQKL